MTVSIANIRVSSNSILPIRIFVNRKQLANNVASKTIFEAPILSSNTLVSLKSPKTRIYLSNNDMKNLCDELKDDILLILYELTSPLIHDTVLQKIRIGTTIDFQENVIKQIIGIVDESIKYYVNISCYYHDFESNTITAKESENNLNTCQEQDA